jgi:polyhydroxyalkanoate synthesis regulator phasin
MHAGRRADSERRRTRVQDALRQAGAAGSEITASSIARAAKVDRSFLYRHPDLLEQIHTAQKQAPEAPEQNTGVSRASLHAELLAVRHRTSRQAARIHQLERKLSEHLGRQTWQDSGLGAPADIDTLNQKITHLEQQVIDLRLQLEEREQDLAAARAANRELMTQLNTAHPTA